MGEQQIASALALATAHGWLALHDLHWPGRLKANLDHVMVGPGGVIVIDAKNWAGDVTVAGGVLRQNGYRRDRETASALTQAAAISALLEPHHRRLVHGWIGLVQPPTIMACTADGARILGRDVLLEQLLALPAVLDGLTVTAIHGHLNRALGGTQSYSQVTTAALPTGIAPSEPFATARRRRTSTAPPPPRPARPAKTAPPAPRRTPRPRPGHTRTGAARLTLVIVFLLFAVTQLMAAKGH